MELRGLRSKVQGLEKEVERLRNDLRDLETAKQAMERERNDARDEMMRLRRERETEKFEYEASKQFVWCLSNETY
jgi:uncharacterized protein (DUF3084 family)